MLGTLVSALGGTGDGMAEAGRAGAEGLGATAGSGVSRALAARRAAARQAHAHAQATLWCVPCQHIVGLQVCLLLDRISYDPARFPRYLPEAYCLCRGCLTGLFGEEDFRYRSAPVYSPAVVLRRTAACAGGRSVYAEHYVTIPVGCTCVPEPDKASDSANSSMDKPGAKLLLGPNDRPAGR
ncbi:Interleukin-17D [Microtus ochrogaster]|uniref:Interleukin-17D n=1 Tax=Microtus ochrogaster TaxID=79684 RepID=A0A8J6GVH6_MICOH|nr:Interleukin-17D [Microtus ochrogaster]